MSIIVITPPPPPPGGRKVQAEDGFAGSPGLAPTPVTIDVPSVGSLADQLRVAADILDGKS